jgi:hypothetical protein
VSDGCRKIRARDCGDTLAQLLPQVSGPDFLDCAFGQRAELERTERNPDQPIHRKPQVPEHVLHFPVLAFPHRKSKPDVGALLAIDVSIDRAIAHPVDDDPAA